MAAISTPKSRALMPTMVIMQLAKAALVKSVGEKAAPLPWLSSGASVMTSLPDPWCVMVVRRSPL